MTANTPLGRVLRDDTGVLLKFERTFTATPEDVWAAITDPVRLGRWFGTWSGDPRSGSVTLIMTAEPDDDPQQVTIVECDEPRRLVLDMPAPDGTWRLELALTGSPGATTLVFRQRLAEPYDASSIGPGWHYYLDRLAAVLVDAPIPDDRDGAYYPALRDAYALPD